MFHKAVTYYREQDASKKKEEAQKISNEFVVAGHFLPFPFPISHFPFSYLSLHCSIVEVRQLTIHFLPLIVGSFSEINVPMEIREKIIESIQAGEFTDDLFQAADKHILSMLRLTIFPLWKKSDLCHHVLKKAKARTLQEYMDTISLTSDTVEVAIGIQD